MHNPRSLLTASIFVFALVMGVGSFSAVSYFGQSIQNNDAIAALHEGTAPAVITNKPENTTISPEEVPPLEETTESPVITARHVVKGTSHKVFGEVMLESRCSTLGVEAVQEDSVPPFIELQFTEQFSSKSDDSCAPSAVEKPTPFSITFTAPADVVIAATWNGNDAILSMIR